MKLALIFTLLRASLLVVFASPTFAYGEVVIKTITKSALAQDAELKVIYSTLAADMGPGWCKNKVGEQQIRENLPYDINEMECNIAVLIEKSEDPSNEVPNTFFAVAFYKEKPERPYSIYLDAICATNMVKSGGSWVPKQNLKGSGSVLLYHINNLAKQAKKPFITLDSVTDPETVAWYDANGFFIDKDIYSLKHNTEVLNNLNIAQLVSALASIPASDAVTITPLYKFDYAKFVSPGMLAQAVAGIAIATPQILTLHQKIGSPEFSDADRQTIQTLYDKNTVTLKRLLSLASSGEDATEGELADAISLGKTTGQTWAKLKNKFGPSLKVDPDLQDKFSKLAGRFKFNFIVLIPLIRPTTYNARLNQLLGKVVKPHIIEAYKKTDGELIDDFKKLNNL